MRTEDFGGSISAAKLAELTGDNRQWIRRNRRRDTALHFALNKDGGLSGPGRGYQFRTGEPLNKWIAACRSWRAKMDVGFAGLPRLVNQCREVTAARDIWQASEALAAVADFVSGPKFMVEARRLERRQGKRACAAFGASLDKISKALQRVANEIR